jgi:lipopolysaccharide biosynthesis glycosyltransferase
MAPLRVACAAEGAYDAHSAALLHSVAEHSRGLDLHVHYLHGPSFPRRSADAIGRMLEDLGVELSLIEVDEELTSRLPVVSEFTVAMWYRIFLPDLVPEADRILYLDVDTIVTDSLEPLADTDLDGYYLGAVTNVFQQNHLHRPRELGLAGPEVYFNSGVLLMNLDEMRRDGCAAALRDYAIENDRNDWPDQDALNVVLGGRRLPLHPRWNVMNSLRFPWSAEMFGRDAVQEALTRPAIRHFEGPGHNKPWHYMCAREARHLYRRHRRATPWPRFTPEGRSARNLARKVAHRLRRPPRAPRAPTG